MTQVKSADDLVKGLRDNINAAADGIITMAMDYSSNFIKNAYTKICPAFWPIQIDGKDVEDPVTGEEFTDAERPENLVKFLNEMYSGDGDIRIAKLWLDFEGHDEDGKLERSAKMQETFGCRPWGRLKSLMRNEFADVINKHKETIKNRIGPK